MKFEAIIAQATSPATQSNPIPNTYTEWGLVGAIAFFLVKEAVSFFKSKDESESKLTDGLVSDLRNSNQALQKQLSDTLLQVQVVQAKSSAAIEEMRRVVTEINNSNQTARRDVSVVIVELRGIGDKVLVQGEQLTALHSRLDRLTKGEELRSATERD